MEDDDVTYEPKYQLKMIPRDEATRLIKTFFLYRVEHNVSFYHITSILKFFTK